MYVPSWLVDLANTGTFPLNVADLRNEFNEILQGTDADSILDDHTRIRCCELLRARQSDIDYLCSLKLHKVIAKHVRASCRRAQAVEESIESWVNLDAESAKLFELADEIANEIRAAWKVQTPPGKEESKFTEVLKLDSIDIFHYGLENLIGYPPTNADFLHWMKREHDQAPFAGRNRDVDPRIEWNIVMQNDTWNFSGVPCQPTIKITGRECTEPLEFYVKKAQTKFEEANAKDNVLNEAEVAALRLWTSPMYEMYAKVLRNPQKPSGLFVTTLHAINSGITKLARIWPLPVNKKVYRGYKNLILQDLKKDRFNCVGGVEKCVLATSEDFNIAVNYSVDGAFILEIEVGQANRGADVSWLSQFPQEREILFNALSNVEFVCGPQQRIVQFKDKSTGNHTLGKLLVYQVHLSANLRSKTLEEFISLRKDLHLNLVDVLAQEAKRTIDMRADKSSHGLIKRLCEECIKQCNAVRTEAEKADVNIFNEGTEEYVGLVKDAIMFQSRSKTIIDLALRWFEDGTADPAEIGGLVGWQLQALRDAFKDSKRPKVTKLVLEKVLLVDSVFGDRCVKLGAVDNGDIAYNIAKLLSLNPELESLDMKVASATLWESVFKELCPGRPHLLVNGFHLAQHGTISTLQQFQFRHSDGHMATMIPPALVMYPPSALIHLNLCGSPIACSGAESLARAFSGLQRLKCLDLGSCQIADRGCSGIAHTLSALSALKDLNLTHNKVDDAGFKILASTIRAHILPRLESVDMRFNTTQLPSLLCGARCVIKNHIVSKLLTNKYIMCLAWSPEGDQIASGGWALSGGTWDNRVIIWDAKTIAKQVSMLEGHSSMVESVAWRPGGDQIVSGGLGNFLDDKPGEIIVWDARTRRQVLKLKGHTRGVSSVAWRPGGDQIASGSHDKTIIIWDAKTGEQISTLKGHTSQVRSVAWRPVGDQIASGSSDKTVIIWDAKTGEQVSTLKGHTSYVKSVAWRPRGDQIVSGGGGSGDAEDEGDNPGEIIIWDATTGKQISTLKGHTSRVTSVAWRPGADQIASASLDGTIIIWDAKTGEQVSKLKGHSHETSVAWRPGGDQIASASYDKTIIIWDAKTGEQVSTLKGHTSYVTSVAWRPESPGRPGGDQIASASHDKKIIIWDVKSGEQGSTLKGHTDIVMSVAWRSGGDQIVSCGYGTGRATFSSDNPGEIIIWDAKTGEQVSVLKGHSKGVKSVACLPGGDQIVSGGYGAGGRWKDPGEIIIWNAKTGDQVSTLKGHIAAVTSVAWRPGGDQIASASFDETIIIWDAKTGEQVSTLKGHTSYVNSVAWRPRGDRIASASEDGTIIIWDAKTGEQILTLEGHTSHVTSVAWRPVGDQIASGSWDETIIIWDAKTGQQVSTLKGHTNTVTSVAWRPGGDQIASASCDNKIIVWDAKTREQISTLKGHTSVVTSVAWCPGGDQIASASYDKTVIIWDAKTGKQVSTLKRHTSYVTSVAWRPGGDQSLQLRTTERSSSGCEDW